MNKKLLMIVIFISALSGCEADPAMWRKAGVDQFGVQNALAKCRYDVGIAKVSPDEKAQMRADCMQSQGFRYY